jgi:hypothetical protein
MEELGVRIPFREGAKLAMLLPERRPTEDGELQQAASVMLEIQLIT